MLILFLYVYSRIVYERLVLVYYLETERIKSNLIAVGKCP